MLVRRSTQAGKAMVNDPTKLMEANYELWKEHVALMQEAMMEHDEQDDQ